ncbi:hypothetical protein C8F01DRAFT_1250390 [Mycena amicta]|nr:hypothetical protein C8F01DRAFT_1250390 [Mycena amicta]
MPAASQRRTRLERENLIPRDESEDIGLDYEDFPTAEVDATMENDSDVVVVEREASSFREEQGQASGFGSIVKVDNDPALA